MRQSLCITSLLLLNVGIGLGFPVQFCERDETKGLDLCFALTTSTDIFTDSIDINILISAKFVDRRGWAAFGIGDSMSGALMFVVYPGQNPDQLTVSPRTTSGHLQPWLDVNTPIVQILSVTTPETDIFEVQVICKSCTSWTGSIFDLKSKAQPFIWASNHNQVLCTEDKNASIQFHQEHAFGSFEIDMTQAHVEGTESHMPILRNGRISNLGVDSKIVDKTMFLMQAHGVLGGLAMLIFPVGVHLLRSTLSKHSFSHHWIAQTVATSMMTTTAATGLWYSVVVRKSFRSVHQSFGILLTTALYAQIYFGHVHHQRYRIDQRRTRISHIHIWMGRTAMFLGILNIFLGCQLAALPYQVFASFLLVWMLEEGILLFLRLRTASRQSLLQYGQLDQIGSYDDRPYQAQTNFVISDESEDEEDEERERPKSEV